MADDPSKPDDWVEITRISTRRAKARGELAVGELLAGRFRISRPIGKGGMGLVYLASDEQGGHPVAIKTVPFGTDEVLEARFRRETRLIAELRHPNIVALVDFGHAEGFLYQAMEYVDGDTLAAVIQRDGALGKERAVAIALQLAKALAAAHVLNVVHRDVKPENIMIARAPRDHVKVLDFGIAKIKHDPNVNPTVETLAGKIIGSLRYITPEQLDHAEITPRTDMYLFGCVLYEMLAGRRVFDYASPADCAIAHYTEEAKPPQVPGTKLAPALVDFIMRCLAKKPAARPADARAAITALGG